MTDSDIIDYLIAIDVVYVYDDGTVDTRGCGCCAGSVTLPPGVAERLNQPVNYDTLNERIK